MTMATTRRPRRVTVYNGTGYAMVYNTAGALIGHGERRVADPTDPLTATLIDQRQLIVKEG